MVFEDLFKDLEERKKKAREMGGAEKVKRHHEQGKFTARERIEKMVDPGSFMEFGLLAHSDQPGMAERTPTDGLIMGYALVNGRRTGIIAHDFTVLASTNAEVNLRKLLQFKTQIKKYKVPLVFLGEAGGARIPDCQGSAGIYKIGGGGSDTLFVEFCHLREYPFVFGAFGECYGVADFEACAADVVVQVKGSAISVSGPRALGKAIGETYSGEEMGGWEIHSKKTGMTDIVAEDEEDCLRIITKYLDYMPSSQDELPPVRPAPEKSETEERMSKIMDILPQKRTRVYDMHKIIECLLDGGEYLELKPNFGGMLITCLGRIDGRVVGLIASNPIVNLGATNTDALEKSTSFMCLCDSFNIPLIFLADTPGHLTGKEAELKRVGSRVVNNVQALFLVTVPKITIIIRKDYGQAMVNMCDLGSGYDFKVAWPTAEIGFMDPAIAADVVYGKLPEKEREKMLKRMIADTSPYPAAGLYHLHDVIHPKDTRKYIIEVLNIVRDSSGQGMSKHLLSTWPKKF
jgi:acetyl-CoA carboxylase carboxyltransferase component